MAGALTGLLNNIPSPTGLVMNLEETVLYMAAARVGLFLQLSGGGGPDGLALDDGGGLVVAHVGLGAVWRFDRRGQPVQRIDAPAGLLTTNIAFGGPDRKTLFITEGATASILVAPVPTPGRLLFSQTDSPDFSTRLET